MSWLFIPFKSYANYIGGPSTFMINLKDFLISKSFKFQSNPRRINTTNGIFFSITYDKFILSYFKKNNLPIIQRLDGIYYPQKHGSRYIDLNKDIKDIYLNYSTHVIFQSEYCKSQCFKMLGIIPEDKYSIIYNGTNKKIFYPVGYERIPNRNEKIKLITTGNFRNLDMIEPIILALDNLVNKYEFELTIIGPVINNEIIKLIKNKSYIRYIKKLNLKKIAIYLRESDIFIYSHLNPPCPNSVIEAISCGKPVVSFDSGSMSELLFFARDLLAPVSDKIFQKYSEFDPILLEDKIEYTFKNLKLTKERAIKYSNLYSFEDTGNNYIKLFNQLLSTI